jgi:hypothetical protein
MVDDSVVPIADGARNDPRASTEEPMRLLMHLDPGGKARISGPFTPAPETPSVKGLIQAGAPALIEPCRFGKGTWRRGVRLRQLKLVYSGRIEVEKPPQFTLLWRIADHEAAGAPHRNALLDLAKSSAEDGMQAAVDQFGLDPFAKPIRMVIFTEGNALIPTMVLPDGRLIGAGADGAFTDELELAKEMRASIARADAAKRSETAYAKRGRWRERLDGIGPGTQEPHDQAFAVPPVRTFVRLLRSSFRCEREAHILVDHLPRWSHD